MTDKELDLKVIQAANKLAKLERSVYYISHSGFCLKYKSGKEILWWRANGETRITEESLNELLAELGMWYEIRNENEWHTWHYVVNKVKHAYVSFDFHVTEISEISAMKKRMVKEIFVKAVEIYEKSK